MAAAFGSSGGEQRQHPSGLPYINVESPTDEERDVLGKQLKKTGSDERKAFLFASPVHKKGKLTTHKRGFYIGPTAVYVKDEHLKRCVPILELGEMYVDRAWMGLSCPTQYGMLMQFPSEEKARQAKKVLTTLHEYLQRNRRRPRELRVTDPLPAGGNMLNHVRVSKPNDWGLEQIESVPVPTQAAVAAQHEEEGLPKHADAGTSAGAAAAGASPARSSSARAAPQLTLQVVSKEEYCGEEEEEVSELDDLELAETEQMQQTRAQMEAEVEAAMLGAQEWERKAGTLKVREAQLERTLRDAKSELEDMAARSAQLSSDLSTAESQGAELRMENEFLKKQQVAACEGLGIVPDGDVSLTEAARRLQAVHDSLTDDNWRLTKEIATLEKRHNELLSESRLGQDRVKLEADAEALRALIEVRATDSHTHERARTDGKNITALTKQLHSERQAHEETKLQLFELTQKHSSLENRFKEHTSTSKQAQRALEKKLKQALQQYQALEEHLSGSEAGAGGAGIDKSFMYTTTGFEKKPRFVTGPGGGGGGSRARSVSQSSVFPSPGRMDGDSVPCNVVYHHSHAHDGPDRAEETELVVGQKVVLNRSGAANKENCGTPAGSGNVATSGKGGADGEPVPCRGVVRYIGRLAGHTGEWVGVELDEKTPGGHSGSLHGKVYFECKAGRGLFIRPSLVAVEGFACRRCASKHLKRTGSGVSEQVFVPPPPPPHHRARSRSPSMSMSMQRSMSLQVAPPPYNAAGVAAAAATTAAAAATASSDEYLQLAIQLKEKLEEAEKRQQHAEPARSPSPKLHPSPASPPPDYSALNASITSAVSTGGAGAPFTSRRGKSRDRSVSPSVCDVRLPFFSSSTNTHGSSTYVASAQIGGPERMQHESAMREALSSCVKQLSSKGGLPRADHSMTSADILWARRKSSQEEQY